MYVKQVADALIDRGVRVFYDEYEKAQLWGKDLYTHLDWIYRDSARFCILFTSAHYAKKVWTNHERRSAQTRAFVENEEYILPARLDDTEIPGILATTGYIDLRNVSPAELALIVSAKLYGKSSHIRTGKLQGLHASVKDLKPEAAIPILIEFIRDSDAELRCEAAKELGNIGTEARSVVASLVMALMDSEEGVRSEAGKALNKIDPEKSIRIPSLINALCSHNEALQKMAISELVNVGGLAVPPILEALRKQGEGIRTPVETTLLLIRAVAIPDLIEALGDTNHLIRDVATSVICRIEPDTTESLKEFKVMMDSANEDDFKKLATSELYFLDNYEEAYCADVYDLYKLGAKAIPALPCLLRLAAKAPDAKYMEYFHNVIAPAEVLESMGPIAKSLILMIIKEGEGDLKEHASWVLANLYDDPLRRDSA